MNRRSFLKITVAGAAAATFLPSASAASNRKLRKAIMHSTIGVKGGLENGGNNYIMSPEQAIDYLDAIHSEWVGWHFDIGNAGRVGPAERWINLLGKRIVKIHVKDFSAKPAVPGGRAGARPKLL